MADLIRGFSCILLSVYAVSSAGMNAILLAPIFSNLMSQSYAEILCLTRASSDNSWQSWQQLVKSAEVILVQLCNMPQRLLQTIDTVQYQTRTNR